MLELSRQRTLACSTPQHAAMPGAVIIVIRLEDISSHLMSLNPVKLQVRVSIPVSEDGKSPSPPTAKSPANCLLMPPPSVTPKPPYDTPDPSPEPLPLSLADRYGPYSSSTSLGVKEKEDSEFMMMERRVKWRKAQEKVFWSSTDTSASGMKSSLVLHMLEFSQVVEHVWSSSHRTLAHSPPQHVAMPGPDGAITCNIVCNGISSHFISLNIFSPCPFLSGKRPTSRFRLFQMFSLRVAQVDVDVIACGRKSSSFLQMLELSKHRTFARSPPQHGDKSITFLSSRRLNQSHLLSLNTVKLTSRTCAGTEKGHLGVKHQPEC